MKELQELFDTLPEHLQHQILIGAQKDGQEIAFHDEQLDSWFVSSFKGLDFQDVDYRIKWNLENKEEIKVGDIVLLNDKEHKYIVFLKDEEMSLLWNITKKSFTRWLYNSDLTLYKPKTEKEELIERLEGLEDIDDIVLLGKETLEKILKYLK